MSQTQLKTRIVIVGGVAGGASAAARARRCNSGAEITVLEKGPAVSFANCGLPYHIGGEIEDREKLLLASPELFWDRFSIRVRTGHEVTHIDRAAKTVTGTQDGHEFKLPYDKLILAMGCEPVRPEFCDVQADNVFQLWTLDDMDAILAYMKNRACKQATVVGAGFVGLEVAEQLVHRKVDVSLVQLGSRVLGHMLDQEFGSMLHRELKKNSIDLHLNTAVDEFLVSNGRVTAVKLSTGETVATELVIVGIGTRPRTKLAAEAGLKLGDDGGVKINDFCQTSDPDIYAAGDIVEYPLGSGLGKARMPFAGPANRSGRIAGTHAAGGKARPLGPVQGTSILRVFELAAGATGLSENACQQSEIECHAATIQATHHAGYFPGARTMALKLVYAPDGKVLGAQAVGPLGVDKRIDVVAAMIHAGGTIDDLASLDLSYAPPFGSAKDPIHMAAFVAQNDLDAFPKLIEPNADLESLQVVDVRSSRELERLPPVERAIHIPVDELASRLEELNRDQETVVVCHSGKRAHVAACLLQGAGFQVKNLNGGMSVRSLFE